MLQNKSNQQDYMPAMTAPQDTKSVRRAINKHSTYPYACYNRLLCIENHPYSANTINDAVAAKAM